MFCVFFYAKDWESAAADKARGDNPDRTNSHATDRNGPARRGIMAANACLGGIPFRATTRVLFVNTEVVVRNDDDGGLDGPKGVS